MKCPNEPTPDVSDGLPMVFVERPRCPRCRSVSLSTERSLPLENDGSRTRRTKCRDCRTNFLVVVE